MTGSVVGAACVVRMVMYFIHSSSSWLEVLDIAVFRWQGSPGAALTVLFRDVSWLIKLSRKSSA